MLKTLAAYAGAVTGAFLLGSILATQFILGNVADMGMDVSLGVRLQATLHDIGGLASTYLPLIAVTFLIALLIATGLLKVFPSRPGLLYLLAGGLALVSLHQSSEARSISGTESRCLHHDSERLSDGGCALNLQHSCTALRHLARED